MVEEVLKEEEQDVPENTREDSAGFSKNDKTFIAAMIIVAIGFSLRGGTYPGSVFASIKQILSSFVYGFGMIFFFIGLTKKTFNFNPSKVQIIRWAVALAAIFAFSEFLHEGYLILTGQLSLKK